MPYFPPSGGGSSFDASSPPPIGNVTPNALFGTSIQTNGFIASTDGTGQLASGNVNWDNLGNMTFGGSTNEFGGDVQVDGNLILTALPTSDPHVANTIWSNLGILTISTG